MPEQITKNQHYVPRFIIKTFSPDDVNVAMLRLDVWTHVGIAKLEGHYVPLHVHAAYHLSVQFDEQGNIVALTPDAVRVLP